MASISITQKDSISAFLIFSTLTLKMMDILVHQLIIQISTFRKADKDVFLKIIIKAL
jgi:hypothetical protein